MLPEICWEEVIEKICFFFIFCFIVDAWNCVPNLSRLTTRHKFSNTAAKIVINLIHFHDNRIYAPEQPDQLSAKDCQQFNGNCISRKFFPTEIPQETTPDNDYNDKPHKRIKEINLNFVKLLWMFSKLRPISVIAFNDQKHRLWYYYRLHKNHRCPKRLGNPERIKYRI